MHRDTSSPVTANANQHAAPAPIETQGILHRRTLLPIVDAGLGHFLSHLHIEPNVAHGHFIGWRIQALQLENVTLKDTPLKPGDTITRINGGPIERPEQAHQTWNSLYTASELVLAYQRDGQTHELRYAIIDEDR